MGDAGKFSFWNKIKEWFSNLGIKEEDKEKLEQVNSFKRGMIRTGNVTSDIWRVASFVIIFLLLFLVYFIMANGLNFNQINLILKHASVIGLLTLGMALVILIGDIDLSLGSMLALIAGFTVLIFNATNSITLTLLFAIIFGSICGLFNGIFVGILKMPAFIVTLATMLIYRSISHFVMNEMDLVRYSLDSSLSRYQLFIDIGNNTFILPIVGIIFLIMVGVMVYITTSTKFGKSVYAVGSNTKAAKLAGINVKWIKVFVFMIAGILVGIAAFLHLAQNGSATPASVGINYELYAIAGAVLGGISMAGGKGKMIGVLFGALSFVLLDKIINVTGANPLINDTIKGAILLLAIGLQMIQKRAKR